MDKPTEEVITMNRVKAINYLISQSQDYKATYNLLMHKENVIQDFVRNHTVNLPVAPVTVKSSNNVGATLSLGQQASMTTVNNQLTARNLITSRLKSNKNINIVLEGKPQDIITVNSAGLKAELNDVDTSIFKQIEEECPTFHPMETLNTHIRTNVQDNTPRLYKKMRYNHTSPQTGLAILTILNFLLMAINTVTNENIKSKISKTIYRTLSIYKFNIKIQTAIKTYLKTYKTKRDIGMQINNNLKHYGLIQYGPLSALTIVPSDIIPNRVVRNGNTVFTNIFGSTKTTKQTPIVIDNAKAIVKPLILPTVTNHQLRTLSAQQLNDLLNVNQESDINTDDQLESAFDQLRNAYFSPSPSESIDVVLRYEQQE
uniref:Uncharacterized protein n=1 Tax=Spodoptera litura male-killing virus TaxID=2996810 RepID=A0AA86IY29_9VIRU|nr:hypothetical protein [Spodoptera litura male-killing virus]